MEFSKPESTKQGLKRVAFTEIDNRDVSLSPGTFIEVKSGEGKDTLNQLEDLVGNRMSLVLTGEAGSDYVINKFFLTRSRLHERIQRRDERKGFFGQSTIRGLVVLPTDERIYPGPHRNPRGYLQPRSLGIDFGNALTLQIIRDLKSTGKDPIPDTRFKLIYYPEKYLSDSGTYFWVVRNILKESEKKFLILLNSRLSWASSVRDNLRHVYPAGLPSLGKNK